MPVAVRRFTGTSGEFHHRSVEGVGGIELWVFDVTRPAIVLGSRQRTDLLDVDACERAGVEIVNRRSGGGLVLLRPAEICWIDVVMPRDAPGWTDDVVVAMHRCGELWRAALTAVAPAVSSELVVHDGPLQRGAVADTVCFGGLGPGEVTLDGAKLVGISQRRTRQAARFQCVLHRRWSPERLVDLLAPGVIDPANVMVLDVATRDVDERVLTSGLVDALRHR